MIDLTRYIISAGGQEGDDDFECLAMSTMHRSYDNLSVSGCLQRANWFVDLEVAQEALIELLASKHGNRDWTLTRIDIKFSSQK